MAKKLYVGNLSYGMTESELQSVFAPFGTVESVQIIIDRDTGRSKGFGFVEMGSADEASAAIQALHDKEIGGRKLIGQLRRQPELEYLPVVIGGKLGTLGSENSTFVEPLIAAGYSAVFMEAVGLEAFSRFIESPQRALVA